MLTCEAQGWCGSCLGELRKGRAHEGDIFRCLRGILALIAQLYLHWGFGAGPGLSRTESLGGVPSGGRGADEVAPEILPGTWDLSHPPRVLAEGD